MRLDRGYGSPYDRGGADSYYRRGRKPHYYMNETYRSQRITELTEAEIAEYNAGFDENEANENFKDYGTEL